MDQQASAPPACYRHPDRPTKLSCSECGKPICFDCTVDAAVGQKCPDCAQTEGRQQTIAVRDTWRVGFGSAPVTITLIVINVAIYLVGRGSIDAESWFIENWAQVKLLVEDGEWWRVLTASFLHGSVFHVAVNMYILYLLGPRLERQTGSATFLALYFASAALGGAVSQLTGPSINNGIPVISIGASGAIFGLFGAWFSASYRHRHTPAGRAMFSQTLTLLVINAAFPLFVSNIDWRAHLGGFLAGVVIHQLWTRLLREEAAANVQRAAIALGVGLAGVISVILL